MQSKFYSHLVLKRSLKWNTLKSSVLNPAIGLIQITCSQNREDERNTHLTEKIPLHELSAV